MNVLILSQHQAVSSQLLQSRASPATLLGIAAAPKLRHLLTSLFYHVYKTFNNVLLP